MDIMPAGPQDADTLGVGWPHGPPGEKQQLDCGSVVVFPRQVLEYYQKNRHKSRTERDFERYELRRLQKQLHMLKQLKGQKQENERSRLANEEL